MNKLFQKIVICLICLGIPLQALAIHDYPADQYWVQSDESNLEKIDHSEWQLTLDSFLDTATNSGINLVDYSALQKNGRQTLNSYLKKMSAISVRDYSKAEQFAYWVNLYNAATVKLIVDNYPVKSIRKLGGWFSSGPWDDELVSIEGKKLTLNDIEHRILRPIWKDFRIHFVVNCASLGCPNLQAMALTAGNTEAQLEAAATSFIRHPRGVEITDEGIRLSNIFKWYQADFGSSEDETLSTLSKYLAPDQATKLKNNEVGVSYQYDWTLNNVR